jgi:3-oxoacyl-[acyl-carrier protein] reductase
MHQDLIEAFSLDGRVAVVTGAASGIGRQGAIMLAQDGARVVLGDVDEAGMAETAALIAAVGGSSRLSRRTDVSVRASVDALADYAVEHAGPVDIWANCAGVIRTPKIIDATEAEVDRLLGINLKGTYWGCAAAARIMMERRRGSIINISSAAADMPGPGLSIYGITKAGVTALTRNLAHEMGEYGVRANAIAPGFIDTPMVARNFTNSDGKIDAAQRAATLEARARSTVLGITGEPSDVGYAILYLASDASRFVTGQVLRPNGGVSML